MRKSVFLFLAAALFAVAGGCDGCFGSKKNPATATFAEKDVPAADLPWREWGAEAFSEAQETGKPVFVSFTSALCLNCRIFDRTSLSNERVVELLSTKFIPVRVQAELQPAVVRRFAESLPLVAVISPDGDLILAEGFVPPSQLNPKLFAALRGETEVKLEAGERRFKTMQGSPSLELARQMQQHFFQSFDNEHARYKTGENRGLRFDDLRFDYFVGHLAGSSPLARDRIGVYVNALWNHLRDEKDGGILTGTYGKGWGSPVPIKRADEQAQWAATIGLLLQPPYFADRLKASPEELSRAAERAVAYLLDKMVQDDKVYAGTVAEPDYYLSEGRGMPPEVSPIATPAIAARTAASLAEAGVRLERPEWIERAAAIARQASKDAGAKPSLDEIAPQFEAALNLYEATGKTEWLEEAHRQAALAGPHRRSEGYFVDLTAPAGTPLESEPVPELNGVLGNALWRLGGIAAVPEFLAAARSVAASFAGSPLLFDDRQGLLGLLLWRVNNPPLRVELPVTWREAPAAARLLKAPDPRKVIVWTDGAARACVGGTCREAGDADALLEVYRELLRESAAADSAESGAQKETTQKTSK